MSAAKPPQPESERMRSSSTVPSAKPIADLFEPSSLGDLAISNRVVMAPMTRCRAGLHDIPTPSMAEYYGQRATAGLIVTEGTQPSAAGKGYCRTPGIYSPEQVEGWSAVGKAVHECGGRIVVQLMHCGRVASRVNKDDASEIVAPSAIRAGGTIFTDTSGLVPMDEPRALRTDEIAGVIEEYVSAARNAVAAGLDGVELHCASGYLPMQFLSPNANQRTDAYGGSVANRIRFAVETLEALSAAIGPGRVGFRICPGFTYNDVADTDPALTYRGLLEAVSHLGLAYLHLIAVKTPRVDGLAIVKAHWTGNLVLNNEMNLARAQAAVSNGTAQAVSFGRDFIANPDLVDRMRHGRTLNAFDAATLYSAGDAGYTDYPTFNEGR